MFSSIKYLSWFLLIYVVLLGMLTPVIAEAYPAFKNSVPPFNNISQNLAELGYKHKLSS